MLLCSIFRAEARAGHSGLQFPLPHVQEASLGTPASVQGEECSPMEGWRTAHSSSLHSGLSVGST